MNPAAPGLWPGPTSHDRRLWLLLLVGYTLVYLWFWPAGPGIHDEAGFVNQALLWTHGPAMDARASRAPVDDLLRIDDRTVTWRNPGRSLLLVPFLPLGSVRALYLSSLLLHLAAGLACAALLRRHGASPLWSALVLFHPTLALYSRTIMADGPAGLALLAAFLALTTRRAPGFLAGLAVGAAAGLRYQTGPLLLFLAAGIWNLPWLPDRRRQAAACLLGGGTIGVALFVYNWYVYGSILGFTGQGRFSLAYLGWNAGIYALALACLWPALPLALGWDRSVWVRPVRLVVIPFLLVMLIYSWHDVGTSPLETMVVSLRLLQPVLPVWILSYALLLEDRIGPWFLRRLTPASRRAVLLLVSLLLLAGQALLFQRHQRHLASLQEARASILATIPPGATVIANGTVRKLFAVLSEEPPDYRWVPYDLDNRVLDPAPALADEDGPTYVALLPKRPGYEFPTELAELVRRLRLRRVATAHSGLLLYRAEPPDAD